MRSVRDLNAVSGVAGRLGGTSDAPTPKPAPKPAPMPVAAPQQAPIVVQADLSGAIGALNSMAVSQQHALADMTEQNRIVIEGLAMKVAELLADRNAIAMKSYTIESVIVRDQNMRMKSIKSIVTTEG